MKTRIRAALGKRVNGNLYFHVTALERLDPDVREQVQRAALQAGLEIEDEFNVIKIDRERSGKFLFCIMNTSLTIHFLRCSVPAS